MVSDRVEIRRAALEQAVRLCAAGRIKLDDLPETVKAFTAWIGNGKQLTTR